MISSDFAWETLLYSCVRTGRGAMRQEETQKAIRNFKSSFLIIIILNASFEIWEFSSFNAKQSEESSISQTPSTASIRYRILNILFFLTFLVTSCTMLIS